MRRNSPGSPFQVETLVAKTKNLNWRHMNSCFPELDQIATNMEAAGVIMPQASQGNSSVFLVRKPGNPKPR